MRHSPHSLMVFIKVYNKRRGKSKPMQSYNGPIFFPRMRMSKSKLFPYAEALFAVIVWGASFIATKVALQDLSPITLVWLRFLMGVVILGLVVMLRRQFTLPDK